MDEEKERVAGRGDKSMERLSAELTILNCASDRASRAHELILFANDPSFWADEDGNVL